jgi:plastocyanin
LAAGLAALPPHGQTGRLEGVVELTRELSVRRPRFRLYAEHGGQPVPPAAGADTLEHGNVVIYLDSVPWSVTPGAADAPARIRQAGERFVPHVLPVVVGTTVEFPNEDPYFHNVFSLSRARTFDLGRYPRGEARRVTFDKPGIVQVFCHIHSDMTAIIVVRDNPYFAVPDGQGRYAITGIPPGEYRVTAWHERIRPVSLPVRIEADRATGVDFTIPLTQ